MIKYYAFADAVDVTPDRFDHYIEVYLASQVEPRIAELEKALREIAVMPTEDNEWDAVDKYDQARAIASKALGE